jgi:N-acetylneuraminate synthase/N,N'-diacetyllegionaminate synthase
MQLFGRDIDKDVCIVAEIGVNHEGDPEAASTLLRLAAEAGAHAVKFQSYTPGRYASADDPARLERVTRFALDLNTHRRLAAEARTLGVHFFSTPLTEDWVPVLAEFTDVIKIASGDLTFEPVVRAAAAKSRIVICSTGLATVDEIDQAVGWIADEVGAAAVPDRLILMQCVSAYPTPIEQANLLSIPFLAERYRTHVGYSNHVIGIEACLAAVALGAPVIEAHFTDRKTGRSFRDHELSLEPQELRELVRLAPRIRASRGVPGKTRQPSEAGNLLAVRKGLVAARDLAAGTVLQRDDLAYARPATEFAAGELGAVIGRRLRHGLQRGKLLRRDSIEN